MPVPQSQAGIISRCEFEMNQREMTNQVSCGSVSGRVRFYSGLTRWLRFRVRVVIFVHQNGSTKRTVRVCLWGNMREVAAASSSHEGHLTRTCFFLPPNPTRPVLCPLPSFPLLRQTFHALVLFSVRGAPEPSRASPFRKAFPLVAVLGTTHCYAVSPRCTAKSAQRLQNSWSALNGEHQSIPAIKAIEVNHPPIEHVFEESNIIRSFQEECCH